MFSKLQLNNLLFLDIETVPATKDFGTLPEMTKKLWAQKTQYLRKEAISAEDFYKRAGIWAEFGKIICISAGYFVHEDEERGFRITSFHGEERQLLMDFKTFLETYFNKASQLLCAHNGKEFDFPYLARRMIIQGIALPHKLNLFGKKPWEVPHLDTMELWKFGDFKHFTSLNLMTHILGIPSPKEDIDGSQVRDIYYDENDLKRIITYCERDTVAVAQVILRLRNEELLQENEILHI